MGVRVPRTRLLASVTAGVLAALAGLAVYSRSGIGDANAAQALTLTSVTAVVIAGASIFGGSGSALAVAAAGLLLQTVTSSLAFLSLGLSWQYWIQGRSCSSPRSSRSSWCSCAAVAHRGAGRLIRRASASPSEPL